MTEPTQDKIQAVTDAADYLINLLATTPMAAHRARHEQKLSAAYDEYEAAKKAIWGDHVADAYRDTDHLPMD